MALVWMKHNEHGGVSAFAEESVAMWAVKGWEPCDPPVDPDPAMAEHVVRPVPEMPAVEAAPAARAQKSPASTETEEH